MRRFYGGLAMLLALVPATTIAVPAVSVTPVDQPSLIPTASYDTFGVATVNAFDASGEVALTTAGSFSTLDFNTAGYTIQKVPIAENGGSPNYNGCVTSTGADFMGRTAWIRINPGVSGKVGITSTTAYDGVLNLFKATKTAYGQASFANLLGSEQCSSRTNGPGAESIGTSCGTGACQAVDGSHDWYVQVGLKCPGVNDPSTCEDADLPPGGVTNIQITFVPDDLDGDGVPDTNDTCPGTAAGLRVNSSGCPDADGDGIADSSDQCPTAAGVPNPSPYNGCPAGPTPPFGADPFVTVLALNGDKLNTSSVTVQLQLNWPQGAQEVVISNGDGGFGSPQRLSAPYIPWTLPPLQNQASEARQVKVIFRGPGIPQFQDSDLITLDTVRPRVPEGEFSAMAGGRWHFFVKATDRGTGVRRVEMLDPHRKVLVAKTFCKRSCDPAESVGLYSSKAKPVYARITDLAGNERTVKLARSLASCAVPPFKVYRVNNTKSRCFALHQSCNPEPGVWDWRHADVPLACRQVRGAYQVELR